jgi:hypothetical protein
MSFRDATRPQDLGPERLKPAEGAPILDASVEAEGRKDLCTSAPPREFIRARLLAWLAEGAREVTSVLCWLPQQRWAEVPPRELGDMPVRDHVRSLVERQTLLRESVASSLGEELAPVASSRNASADELAQDLATIRFELLQRVESAPDDVWDALEWTLLSARQHELQHLAAIWKIALNWGRTPVDLDATRTPGVPLHPADRLEESH